MKKKINADRSRSLSEMLIELDKQSKELLESFADSKNRMDNIFKDVYLERAELYAYRSLYHRPPENMIQDNLLSIKNKLPLKLQRIMFNDETEGKQIQKATRKNVSLKVYKGGLYKPSNTPRYIADDLISGTFKKWQREQIAKENNPEMTT